MQHSLQAFPVLTSITSAFPQHHKLASANYYSQCCSDHGCMATHISHQQLHIDARAQSIHQLVKSITS